MGSMKWFRGVLPRKQAKKDRYYALDIECAGLNPHDPLLICVVPFSKYSKQVQDKYVFTNRDELLDWLENLPSTKNHIIYSHNGSKFDNYAIFNSALDIVNARKFAIESTIYSISYRSNIEFRDSLHLLQAPLRAFGSKGITPEKFINKNHPHFGLHGKITEEDIEYCVQDCVILKNALIELRSLYREWTGKVDAALPYTAASMAHKTWSARYWSEDWKWTGSNGRNHLSTKIDKEADASARLAYYGGRVQVFCEEGELYENVASFDRNSKYPTIMLNEELPDPTSTRKFFINRLEIIREKKYLYWGKFTMEGDDSRAFLPSKDEDGRRDYTQKTFEGYLCSPEVERALDCGWKIIDGEDLYYAEKTVRPFKEYVEFFYSMRMEMKNDDDERQQLIKILLNSLYGKFGQKGGYKQLLTPEEINGVLNNPKTIICENEFGCLEGYEDEEGNLWEVCYWSADSDHIYLQCYTEDEAPEHSCFQWAAFITSYARVQLDEAIEAMGDNYEVLYTDTDSVHIAGFQEGDTVPLELGKKLGQWEIEGVKWTDGSYYPVAREARYWEPKAYTWANEAGALIKIKHKGCNRSTGDLTKQQFNESVIQWKTAMRRGLQVGKSHITPKKSKKHYKEIIQ